MRASKGPSCGESEDAVGRTKEELVLERPIRKLTKFFLHGNVFAFQEGSVKVKCVAMLLQVYLKSHEISFEVKRPRRNLVPVLESRDKNGKSQSNNAGKVETIKL